MSESPPLKLDLVAARSAIKTIQDLELNCATIEEVIDLLNPVFYGLSVSAPRFDPGLRLFRARSCEKPANIREVFYPPAHVVPMGRVNRPGNPILYCSNSREATLFELRPLVGATVAIVHWETSAPMMVNHVGYVQPTFEALRSARVAGTSIEFAQVPPGEGHEEIAKFLAELFTKSVARGEEQIYKLTNAVAEKLFIHDLFDGLLYPTIQMRANADNFALKPRYADVHLKFLKIEFARIDSEYDFKYDITLLDTAITLGDDGSIQWRGRNDRWVVQNAGDQLTLSVENGRWVARDVNGIVGPE